MTTKRKRTVSYLTQDDIYYIRRHLAQGIPKERIAAKVYCDIEEVERVANFKKKDDTAAVLRTG